MPTRICCVGPDLLGLRMRVPFAGNPSISQLAPEVNSTQTPPVNVLKRRATCGDCAPEWMSEPELGVASAIQGTLHCTLPALAPVSSHVRLDGDTAVALAGKKWPCSHGPRRGRTGWPFHGAGLVAILGHAPV